MSGGMDLRDYFAGQAMIGVWSDQFLVNGDYSHDATDEELKKLAAVAYRIADAMIAERRSRDVEDGTQAPPAYHDMGGEQWIEMRPGERRTANTRYKFRSKDATDNWDLIHPATIGIELTPSSCKDYIFIRPLTRAERNSL